MKRTVTVRSEPIEGVRDELHAILRNDGKGVLFEIVEPDVHGGSQDASLSVPIESVAFLAGSLAAWAGVELEPAKARTITVDSLDETGTVQLAYEDPTCAQLSVQVVYYPDDENLRAEASAAMFLNRAELLELAETASALAERLKPES